MKLAGIHDVPARIDEQDLRQAPGARRRDQVRGGQEQAITAPPPVDFSRIPIHPPGRLAPASFRRARIQAELAIGAVGDPLEREADRVADQVTADQVTAHQVTADQVTARPGSSGPTPLQWRPGAAPGSETAQRELAPASVDAALTSPGRALDPTLQQDMEHRIGHDFSRVRVHSGSAAEESAHDLGANAYAVGADIIFAAGQYAPHTQRGRRLIAHELAHVVQQSGVARVARNGGPAIPPVLSFLTPAQIAKLKGFGDADFQSTLSTLQGHLRKTKGMTAAGDTQKYIDIRQAAGELRTFLDYVNDPATTAVKVVPGQAGGRSPDMYVRYAGGQERRVEVYNLTVASPEDRPALRTLPEGGTRPRIPREELPGGAGQAVVDLPVNEFKDTAIKAAIRSKIKSSAKGPSQLEAQNPNTVAGGEPMEVGGDVVVQVTHGTVTKARLDEMIKELEPELSASAARRVQVNAVDADEPRAGRKIFEYNRQGDEFAGLVRKANLPGGARPAPAPGAAGLAPTEQPGPIEAPALGGTGAVKMLGGFVFALLIQFALAAIISKVRQKIEEAQVARALDGIRPQISDRLNALSGEVLERQSASEQPLFATVTYSLNYLHGLEDATTRSLNFGSDEHDLEGDHAFQQAARDEANFTIVKDAALGGVTLAGGAPPPESSSSLPPTRDPSGTYETLTFTFEKAVPLQRASDTELRDYVILQSLAEELNGPADRSASDRASELHARLDRLQGSIAAAEKRQQAERERERQAEKQRQQAKLAQAREALTAPSPAPATALLPGPGGPAPERTSSGRTDPFNLFGRPQQKSLFELAQDGADIAEALKDEFVHKAEELKRSSPSQDKIAAYRADAHEWVTELHQAYETWKAKGSPDWPAVKRFEYLAWWVDQPEGKAALML